MWPRSFQGCGGYSISSLYDSSITLFKSLNKRGLNRPEHLCNDLYDSYGHLICNDPAYLLVTGITTPGVVAGNHHSLAKTQTQKSSGTGSSAHSITPYMLLSVLRFLLGSHTDMVLSVVRAQYYLPYQPIVAPILPVRILVHKYSILHRYQTTLSVDSSMHI